MNIARTHTAFVRALPPVQLTIQQLWLAAHKADKHATACVASDQEYHVEELAASQANSAFWTALETETGLTREQIGERT